MLTQLTGIVKDRYCAYLDIFVRVNKCQPTAVDRYEAYLCACAGRRPSWMCGW